MRYLRVENTVRPARSRVALLLLGVAFLLSTLSSSPAAEAKGLVWFTFCGENSCARKTGPRFTAAMLYGGRLHTAPSCVARAHVVTAVFAPNSEQRRYLLVASRGLIGEQGRKGRVWWRQVRGHRQKKLVGAVRGTGPGFKANIDIGIDLFHRAERPARKWTLEEDGSWSGRITCEL